MAELPPPHSREIVPTQEALTIGKGRVRYGGSARPILLEAMSGHYPRLFLNLPFIILLILSKSFSGASSIIFKLATVTWKEKGIKEILFYFPERTDLKEEASCEDHAAPSEIVSWLGEGPPSLPTSGTPAQKRPPGLARSLLTTCALCFVVGGLRSPWRGEYKEPRHPPPLQAHPLPSQGHPHQTLCAPPGELSAGAPGLQPAKDAAGGAPKLQPPPPPDPPEQIMSPSLHWGKEESGTWDPLPLSSLDPAPARNPSSPERKATFPEQELQQLEIGMGSCGLQGLGHQPDLCPKASASSSP